MSLTLKSNQWSCSELEAGVMATQAVDDQAHVTDIDLAIQELRAYCSSIFANSQNESILLALS